MLTQVHSSMKRLDYPVYSFIQKVIIICVIGWGFPTPILKRPRDET